MHYRGTRVPLSERNPRFAKAGIPEAPRWGRKAAAQKEEGKKVFLKWVGREEDPAPQAKVYSFYRPGVTPVEDTPGFSRAKEEWAPPPAKAALKWPVRIGGLALLILALVWSKEKTTALLQDVAGLKLAKVTVEGNHYLGEEAVVKAAALPLGENMFKLDLPAAAARIGAMDWVERVFIERRLPSSILISVKERKPLALVDAGDLYGVDRDGRVLSPSPALRAEDLPLISGVAVPADAVGTTKEAGALKPALDFFAFLRKKDEGLAQDVSEVNLSEADSLKVTFIDGIQAVFDPEVTEADLHRMALVMSDLNGKGKRAGAMDFRYKDMVVVRTR